MQSSWRAALALVFCLGVSAPAEANLRAPIYVEVPPSAALKPATPDLIVEGEHLSFKLGRPYAGSESTAYDDLRQAEIEAVYQVRASAPAAAPVAFEFIMPSVPNAVEVLINGKAVPAHQAAPKPIEKDKPRTREDELVSVRFEGALQEGSNELRVRYRQPLGKYEMRYGYFTSSTWASAVEYELWPLHEWQLAPDFRLQVEVSFADDTAGLRRVLFGSHYKLELLGYEGIGEGPDYGCYRIGTERCAPGQALGGETTYADGIATRRLTLGAKFPARLVAIVRQD